MFNFAQVKLKHTQVNNDNSKPILEITSEQEEEFNRVRSKIREVDAENWIEQLGEHTMKSHIITLSREDAIAFYNTYDSAGRVVSTVTPQDKQNLEKIISQIDEYIQQFRGGVCFVKFSSRSPKDATLFSQRTEERAKQYITDKNWIENIMLYSKEYTRIEHDDLRDNIIVAAALQASIESMCVTSGKEAIDLLLSSRRIYDDIGLELDDLKKRFSLSIILREWIDIPVHLEFRGFVFNQTLTALSQYNYVCVYPSVIQNEHLISRRILNYFNTEIKPRLSHLQNYIIDFAFTSTHCGEEEEEEEDSSSNSNSSSNKSRIMVIELNPYNDYVGNGTSPCLFHWDNDRHLIEDTTMFTFRTRKQSLVMKQSQTQLINITEKWNIKNDEEFNTLVVANYSFSNLEQNNTILLGDVSGKVTMFTSPPSPTEIAAKKRENIIETKGGSIHTIQVVPFTKLSQFDIITADSIGNVCLICNNEILSRRSISTSITSMTSFEDFTGKLKIIVGDRSGMIYSLKDLDLSLETSFSPPIYQSAIDHPSLGDTEKSINVIFAAEMNDKNGIASKMLLIANGQPFIHIYCNYQLIISIPTSSPVTTICKGEFRSGMKIAFGCINGAIYILDNSFQIELYANFGYALTKIITVKYSFNSSSSSMEGDDVGDNKGGASMLICAGEFSGIIMYNGNVKYEYESSDWVHTLGVVGENEIVIGMLDKSLQCLHISPPSII